MVTGGMILDRFNAWPMMYGFIAFWIFYKFVRFMMASKNEPLKKAIISIITLIVCMTVCIGCLIMMCSFR